MAIVQLTDAGVALLKANTGPVTVTDYELGTGFNYTPDPTSTALKGTEVYSGSVPAPVAITANVVLYSVYVDYPVGPFTFGEFGLYVGSTLFALGSMTELLEKTPLSSVNPGNAIRIDIYLSMVGTNYAMWLNLNQSNNNFRLGVLQSPDYLPASSNAVPNAYVLEGSSGALAPFLAYTDTSGLWNFDAYDYAQQATQVAVTATDSKSVTLALSQYGDFMNPDYFGEVLLQFSTGELYSICRYVETVVTSGNEVTLGFSTPLAILPAVGDSFVVFNRNILTTTISKLPIATATTLGAIKVGDTLSIGVDGTLNINPATVPVTSVNGQVGDVELKAVDIPDLAKVASSGLYSDLVGAPAAYKLPTATTLALGGVKAPPTTEKTLVIAGDGTIDLAFSPVKSVNKIAPDPTTGNVDLTGVLAIGLVNPTAIAATTDLNTVTTAGLYFITTAVVGTLFNIPGSISTEATLEVIPFTTTGTGGDVIQRLSTATQVMFRGLVNSVWQPWYTMSGVRTHTEETITATADGQSSFTTVNGYIVGNVEMFLAGLRLRPNVDFQATDGATVSIINTALAAQIKNGAVLTVSSFPLFNVTDAVLHTELRASTGSTLVGYNGSTVSSFLNQLANGGATAAGTLTGTEIVAVSRGAGLLDTTTGEIAALAAANAVTTFNTRKGDVTLVLADITGVGGAPINSPTFTGTPRAPTPAAGDSSTEIATTAFVANYAPLNSPAFTGIPTAPTPATTDNSTTLATTAFVKNLVTSGAVISFNTRKGDVTLQLTDVTAVGGAPLDSPAFTGTATALTAPAGNNSTAIATTAFVAASKYYDIQGGAANILTASQILAQHVAVRTLTFPAVFAGSAGYAGTVATASVTLTVSVLTPGGTPTQVGTIVFAAGSATPTFTTTGSAAVTVAKGQVLIVTAPATADTTLSNVSFTLLSLAT